MKILVTGANGYLGQGIVKAILDKGNEVIAADFKIAIKDGKFVLLEDNGEKDLCLKRDFAKKPGAKFKEIMRIIKNTE